MDRELSGSPLVRVLGRLALAVALLATTGCSHATPGSGYSGGGDDACHPACKPSYRCQGGNCVFGAAPCTSDDSCQRPYRCHQGSCLLPGGAACTNAVQCASNTCVQGVCVVRVL